MSEFYPTYDPKRNDVAGYVADLKAQRSAKARKLVDFRKRFKSFPELSYLDIKTVNKFARLDAGKHSLSRCDAKSLRALAIANWNYAESRCGYGDYDTEYYSACGYDDYIGEKKEYSRSLALEIWRTVGRF